MESSTYDPCLLISTPSKPFRVVGMQTDDTLILGSTEFSETEDQELNKAKGSSFFHYPVDFQWLRSKSRRHHNSTTTEESV
jgi:hypothetical protein